MATNPIIKLPNPTAGLAAGAKAIANTTNPVRPVSQQNLTTPLNVPKAPGLQPGYQNTPYGVGIIPGGVADTPGAVNPNPVLDPTATLNIPKPPVSPLHQYVTDVNTPPSTTGTPKDQLEADWQTAKAAAAADHAAHPEIRDNYAQYATYDDYRNAMAINSGAATKQAIGQLTEANRLDTNQFNINTAKSRSAEAGVTASNAQGREGVTTSGAPLATQGFKTRTEADIAQNQGHLDQATAQRDAAALSLQQAQDSGDMKSAEAYQGQLTAAQNKIYDIQKQNADLAHQAVADAATIAGTQKVKQDTLLTNFTAMGADAANLSDTAVQTMADNAGITFGQASAMRATSVLLAQQATAKTDQEKQRLQGQIDKLAKELPSAGQSNNQIDYNYYKSLSSEDQAGFLKYLTAKNPLQTVTDATTGNVYGVDPYTKDLKIVIDPSQINDSLPSTSADRTIDIATVGTGKPLPLGTLGPLSTMRTDRHNNPIADNAYPVAISRLTANGLVQGQDFQVGETDNNGNTTIMYKDPATGVRGSIVGLKGGDIASWYTTSGYSGTPAILAKLSELTGTNVKAGLDAQKAFNGLDTAGQTDMVKTIYGAEGGKILFQPSDNFGNNLDPAVAANLSSDTLSRVNSINKSGDWKALALAVANYTQDPATATPNRMGGKTMTPYQRTQLIEDARKINPNYNDARYKANKALTDSWYGDPSGNTYAAQNNNINTAIKHLGTVYDTFKALGNGNLTDANSIKNYIASHTGDADVIAYQGNVEAVATELAKAISGSNAPTQSSIEAQSAALSKDLSPAGMEATVKMKMALLGGKIGTNVNSYKKSIGMLPTEGVLDQESQDALSNMGLKPGEYDPTYKEPVKNYDVQQGLDKVQELTYGKSSQSTSSTPSYTVKGLGGGTKASNLGYTNNIHQ